MLVLVAVVVRVAGSDAAGALATLRARGDAIQGGLLGAQRKQLDLLHAFALARVEGDAAKAAIDDPKFVADMANRGIDVDYRPGKQLRADLLREYRVHTAILDRIGMLKR